MARVNTTTPIAPHGDIRLQWKVVPESEVAGLCANVSHTAYGCAYVYPGFATLIVSEGIAFSETCDLAHLGHEVNHAMGAQHK